MSAIRQRLEIALNIATVSFSGEESSGILERLDVIKQEIFTDGGDEKPKKRLKMDVDDAHAIDFLIVPIKLVQDNYKRDHKAHQTLSFKLPEGTMGWTQKIGNGNSPEKDHEKYLKSAQSLILNDESAIKVYDGAEVESFSREAFLYLTMNHKSILKVEAVFSNCIYLERGAHDFSECIFNHCTHDTDYERHSFNAFKSVTSGLEYLHSKEIYHLDINPNNIIITQRGEGKISDFGTSVIGLDDELSGYTPFYWLKGKAKHPDRDVWALGITACEILMRMKYGSVSELMKDAREKECEGEFLKIKKAALCCLNEGAIPSISEVTGNLESV